MIRDQVLPSSYLNNKFFRLFTTIVTYLYIFVYTQVYISYISYYLLKKKNSYCKNDTSSQNKSRPVNVIMDRKLSHFKIVECCCPE